MREIKAMLFDMGGVVTEIDFHQVFSYWARHTSLTKSEIARLFEFDEPYRLHETGKISASAYFCHLRKRLGLTASDAEIKLGWNAIYGPPIWSVLEAIQDIGRRLPCYAFTNSNATHQTEYSRRHPEVSAMFKRIFVSSDIGHRKPDRAAFQYVSDVMAVPLQHILFFDDTEENIIGARAIGMSTVHVRGPEDVLNAVKVYRESMGAD